MITGTGIDITEIERIDQIIKKWGDRFLKKVFTEKEIEYCNGKAFAAQHYAARFACKEAFYKAASDNYFIVMNWKSIEISNSGNGKPFIDLSSQLKEKLKNTIIHLSLSHSTKDAIAIVILEEAPRQVQDSIEF
jgi:holo-[acyl-carrier protein] synthase